jgi:hypothetical protein
MDFRRPKSKETQLFSLSPVKEEKEKRGRHERPNEASVSQQQE